MVNSANKEFDEFIEQLGGLSAAAKLLGVGPSAICNWRTRGGALIPPKHFERLLPFRPPLRLFSFNRETAA